MSRYLERFELAAEYPCDETYSTPADADEVVPFEMGPSAFEAAGSPDKVFWPCVDRGIPSSGQVAFKRIFFAVLGRDFVR